MTDDARAADEILLAQLVAPLRGHDEARAIAGALLARFGSIAASIAAPIAEIERTLGPSDRDLAARLGTLQALVVNVLKHEVVDRPLLKSTDALKAYLRVSLAHEPREQFRVLYLDKRLHLILDERMSEGTIDHAPVYPREVVRRALELGAHAIAIAHNHPGGDPTPSYVDISMTEAIEKACEPLGLQLVDHLIVARRGVRSLHEDGLLGPCGKRERARRTLAAVRKVAAS
jgi:DNA repair protein RadC